ncbi:hypothetical protein L6164_028167 [Bauhinia variegata]|uniref:Uncharacterized protein n=1 Tax=Bauhinia variegata TaxID=167791 RepID=A0ACB9LW77_BAUVA|nr:hypothetical protein L6164_028167 [Bauhinia variegata]
MASSSPMDEMKNQEQEQQQQQQPVKELMHKTKIIQFLGRTTPIILQNDNGPCPLLAICNVLLLRNNLNLSPDIAEVSQEKLLSLVAERLIDSNSNVNDKDAGYVQNQQQNIADAIDLLPRLATGIDVNIKFRRIDDFEFTPECAIFDLLDIPLCHGWIVDPQDHDTANVIGSKSYNALTGELVALETRNMESQPNNNPEEDSVDFAAATTAVLGVPSPNLSKTRSFDDSPRSGSGPKLRKGDLEEEAELLRALKLSVDSVSDPPHIQVSEGTVSVNMDEITCKQEVSVDSGDNLEKSTDAETKDFHKPEPSLLNDYTASRNDSKKDMYSVSTPRKEAYSSIKTDGTNDLNQTTYMGPEESVDQNDGVDKNSPDTLVQAESAALLSSGKASVSLHESHADVSGQSEKVHNPSTLITNNPENADEPCERDATGVSCLSAPHTNTDSSSGRFHPTDGSGASPTNVDGSEPIYEGEECVLDTRSATFEDREPVYEGEMVLAERADKSSLAASDVRANDELSPQQGELIRSFFRNNASQLTFYGLFCLQDGLKERELCVFFRNNHFSTMFKFEGELYLLATDQGYINQPDLVWEKLNEVNGDTLFMTGNFKEFKVESHGNSNWDVHNAVTSTADYLASIDKAAQGGLEMNSDLQLAIALQQQEFEQQPQRHNSQQASISPSSRLVTGPQVARNSGRHSSSSSSKPEGKSKDKCTVM